MFVMSLSHLRRLTTAEIWNVPRALWSSNRTKTTLLDERVVITDDGSTVVCWHPPKPFPYDCSRPLPKEEIKPQNTILKVENKADIIKVFKSTSDETTRKELMGLTSTTKHRWFPNSLRFKKNYKRIKSDREWL